VIGFVSGFLAPLRGFAHITARPGLWPWVALPVALNVALCVGVGWAWFGWASPALERWTVDALGGAGSWWGEAVEWATWLLMLLAAAPLLLGAYLALSNVVGGPFYEVLCEHVENAAAGVPDDAPRRGLFRAAVGGLRVEAGNLVVTLVGGVFAFAVTLLFPPFGAFVAAPFAWFLAGFGFLAYPFDRRATTLGFKLRAVLRRLGVALGFGLAVSLALPTIILLPIVAPCAVAGAALLFPHGRPAGSRR